MKPQWGVRSVFLVSAATMALVFGGSAAWAATDSAATLTDFRTKLDAAMHDCPSSYTITYTGGGLTGTDVSNLVHDVYSKDDYLWYSTKRWSASLSGTNASMNVTYTFSLWENKAQADFVKTKAAQVLSTIITPGMNDLEKEKAIHDWIEVNLAYDTSLVQHSAYAALVSPYRTVCQGYALLAYRMLTDAGIENRIVEGTVHGVAHTWNLVKLDGKWYHLDTTWDDPVPDVKNRIVYSYYNLTDDQIAANHVWDKTKYPTATTSFSQTLQDKITSDPSKAAAYQKIADDLKRNSSAPVSADSVTLSTYSATLKLGGLPTAMSVQLSAAVSPINASDGTVTWRSADPSIATVTSKGLVKAMKAGSTVITATTINGKTATANIEVAQAVTGVTVSSATYTIKVGGPDATLIATVKPLTATNRNVTWSSSKPSTVTVDTYGTIHAVASGTAIVTATTVDGAKKANVTVKVPTNASGLTLDKSALTLKIGGPNEALRATVAPVAATDKTVAWSSSATAVATVNAKGIIMPVSEGTATVTATARDGGYTATSLIRVLRGISNVSLDQS